MHYLGSALYAEGPRDYHFLPTLLRRCCEHVCLTHASAPVEVPDVLSLDHPPEFDDSRRDRRIVESARAARGAWRVLFVHTDGAGDPRAARAERVDPACALLAAELAGAGVCVAVVPVRETESWMLADENALRATFAVPDDVDLAECGIEGPIESIRDPKASLESVFEATKPTSRRRRLGVSPLLGSLAERIELERLRALTSFVAFENELLDALRELAITRD